MVRSRCVPNPPAFVIFLPRYDHTDSSTRPATKKRAGLIDGSGRYRIELCEGWTGCSTRSQFVGFNNKTCGAGVPPYSKDFGQTVGPHLRSSAVSVNWRTWVLDVVAKTADRTVVTIKNDFDKAQCTGRYIDIEHKETDVCEDTLRAQRLHMHRLPLSGPSSQRPLAPPRMTTGASTSSAATGLSDATGT